jgi:hypothetical protein
MALQTISKLLPLLLAFSNLNVIFDIFRVSAFPISSDCTTVSQNGLLPGLKTITSDCQINSNRLDNLHGHRLGGRRDITRMIGLKAMSKLR